MRYIVLSLLFFAFQAKAQRRELEADIKGIAGSAFEVISDDPKETTFVKVGLTLLNIVDYNPKEQLLDLSGYLSISWTDKRFAWSPHEYGNISRLSIPCSALVKPDIRLYNSARRGLVVDDKDLNCALSNTGEVYYIPQVSINSYCPNNDPSDDTFSCDLKFGSWTHPCQDLNITRGKDIMDFSEFQGGWRWQILEHSAKINVDYYSCCPEPYCDATLRLKFRDKSRTPRGRWYFPHCL